LKVIAELAQYEGRRVNLRPDDATRVECQ